MYPLIEIKSVPIEIQMKTKHASLEYTRGTAEMEISRSDSGGLDIKSRPIKVQLDTYEGSNARTPRNNIRTSDFSDQVSYSATAAYARMGSLTLSAKFDNPDDVASDVPVDAAAAQVISTAAPTVQAPIQQSAAPSTELPPAGSGSSAVATADDSADMKIRYEMDKLNFDWKIDKGEFKFTPGDIEISVVQQPQITIKYIGGAIYVPPSSDPNYVPVDVKA